MAKECREWFKMWEKIDDEDFVVARKGIEWRWVNKITNYSGGITKRDTMKDYKFFNFNEKDVMGNYGKTSK